MANGLLDFLNTPGGIGLLSGIATYAANARRGTPVNNIGRGLAGGLAGYGQAKDDIAREQENAFNRQFKNYQLEDLRQKIEAAKAAKEWKAGLPKMMEQAKTKVTPFEADDPFNQGPEAFGEIYGGPQHGQQASGAMANIQPGNPQALQAYMMQPESPYADKLIERQLLPKEEEPFTLSPGQKRFKGGQVVAEAPGEQKVSIKRLSVGGGKFRDFIVDEQMNPVRPWGEPYKKSADASEVNATAIGTKDVAKSLGGPVGDRAEQSLSMAEGATETMTNANMVRQALNKGLVIAGPLAGVRMKWAQIKNLAGAGDLEQLETTRTTIQGLAALTLDSRAALKGQGQITEGETKLLERARSGNIDEMTVSELQTVADISQRLAQRQWEKHQNLLGIMRNDPNAQASYQYYVPTTELPQAVTKGGKPAAPKAGALPQKAPAGVDPKAWQYMTPEERKLWLK